MKQIDEQEFQQILNLEAQSKRYYGVNTILAWVCTVLFSAAAVLTVQIEICFVVFLFCAVMLVIVGVYFTFLYINAKIRWKRLKSGKVQPVWGVCTGKEPFIVWKSGGGTVLVSSETQSSYRITADDKTYNMAQKGVPLWVVDFGRIFFIEIIKCYFPQAWKKEKTDNTTKG
ncbi:MAG: hypothetical protein ACI4M3_00490 [Acutalibacteraceae bacterium]